MRIRTPTRVRVSEALCEGCLQRVLGPALAERDRSWRKPGTPQLATASRTGEGSYKGQVQVKRSQAVQKATDQQGHGQGSRVSADTGWHRDEDARV